MNDQQKEEAARRFHEFVNRKPVAQCSACQRKTWEEKQIGRVCNMRTPSGEYCEGIFRAIS